MLAQSRPRPQVTQTFLRGTFTNSSGDTIVVDGKFDISTIFDRRYQTVLFLKQGFGPDQIELHSDHSNPTREFVVNELKASRFYTW